MGLTHRGHRGPSGLCEGRLRKKRLLFTEMRPTPGLLGWPNSDSLVLPLSQAEHSRSCQEGHPCEQLRDKANPAEGQGPAKADVHLVQQGPLLQEASCLPEGGS